MIDIVALYALFGTSLPMSKILLVYSPPIFLAGIRLFVAGLILLVINHFRQKWFKVDRQVLWDYSQIIIFGVYLKYVLRYWALDYMTATKMAFLLNSSPFMAAFFSYLAFKERLTIKQWVGIFIGFIGLIPILITTSKAEQSFGEFLIFSWPEIVIFIAVAAHSYGMIISRKLIRDQGHSVSLTNGLRMFGGGVLALITSYVFEYDMPVTNIGLFTGWLMLLVFVSNIVCHNLSLALLKRYTVTFVSFSEFLAPLFTAFYSWLFLGEYIDPYYYFSSVFIVFIGLYLFYQDELKSIYITA